MAIKRWIDARPYLVIPLALAVLIVPVLLIELRVAQLSGGTFMYPLDDTFIHMTVAKTLALHGNWGIAPGEFESASSSVGYTLLLAALFKAFGVHAFLPFLINLITAVVVVLVVDRWLKREQVRPFARLVILAAVVLLTPLPILVITGMEHTLQCLFSFLFLFGFAEWLAKAGPAFAKASGRAAFANASAAEAGEAKASGRAAFAKASAAEAISKMPVALFVYAFFACLTRYEGAFLVGIACLMLLYKRRVPAAFLLGAVGALPIIVFGAYSILQGSYFLPNSVLLKSDGARLSLGGLASFFFQTVEQKLTISLTGIAATVTQHLLVILPLSYLALAGPLKRSVRFSYVLLMLIVTTFLQLTLASTGWFYRYEAYLVLCTVCLLAVMGYHFREELMPKVKAYPAAVAFLVFALFLPMAYRTAAAFTKAPRACMNIYDQQYQMAKFLHRYYNDQVIAVNDIGAVSFFKKEKNIDLMGLADIKVARSKKDNYCSPGFLDSLSRSEHAGVAIVFDSWFSDSLLAKWNKVATWTIPDNVICQDSTVTFYAIDKGQTGELRNHLEQYQPSLPFGVHVHYFN
ncbi:MAG TPA: hypothetical protein VN616_00600 [Puia sp.]|nr:hypothetical protein [Puia sp.]